MTEKTNTAEGGTNGATVTIANSGGASGTAFTEVTTGVTYSSARKIRGNLGFTSSTPTTDYTGYSLSGETKVLIRDYFRLATATLAHTPMRIGLSTSGVSMNILNSGPAGRVQLFGLGTNQGTSTAVLSSETVYRGQLYADSGASIIRGAVWDANDTLIWDSGNVSLAIGSLVYAYFGHYATVNDRADWDDVGVRTGVDATWTSWPITNLPPTGSLTNSQNVAAGTTVTVSSSIVDPDGFIASYAWSVLSALSTASVTLLDATTGSAPTSTTTAVTFTAPAAENVIVVQCIATDNSGATLTAVSEVRSVSTSMLVRPYPLNGSSVGTWTIAGGSSTDGAALADESNTTYLESPILTSTETSKRIKSKCPASVLASGQMKHILGTDTGTASAIVRLYEGTTLRQTWTQSITSTPTEYTFTLDPTTIAAITDRGALYYEIAGSI